MSKKEKKLGVSKDLSESRNTSGEELAFTYVAYALGHAM